MSSENTPRYTTSLFCTPETLFLLPIHFVSLSQIKVDVLRDVGSSKD
jgi:hypothetical protein